MDTHEPAPEIGRDHLDPQIVARKRIPLTAVPVPDHAIEIHDGWEFQLLPAADTPLDEAAWQPIAVPANWQLTEAGRADTPIYTNVQYPWPCDPPNIPAENPTGHYRNTLHIPAGWDGDRVFITFDGVDSAFHLIIDSEVVGYSTDSRLPAGFELTDLVAPGSDHLIELRVPRWSAGSYLEDQDMWWLSGIHRRVRLWSSPIVKLHDLGIRTPLDTDMAGSRLELRVDVDGELDGHRIRTRFATHDGTMLIDHHSLATTGTTLVARPLGIARRWFAEDPYLHDLIVDLLDIEGEVVDSRTIKVGVRQVDVAGGVLLVNGRPTEVRGVNRHDHDPDTGKVISVESMRRDIELMKQHNVNAVRCAHYPNDSRFLDLCDRLGIYVVDEANNECHGAWDIMPNDSSWSAQLLARVERMVERDKNHACVIMWSLGNECGWGPGLDAAAKWLRGRDSRPIHYHPADHDQAVDVIAPMYPSSDDLRRLAEMDDDRPVVMCEYAHSMGNSTGNLDEYWDLIRSHPRLWGGFIWDWADQGLRRHGDEALAATGHSSEAEWWAYGGDFGDEPNDAAFCCNGLVSPDREPHPALRQLKHVYSPIGITVADAKAHRIRIENRHQFLDLQVYAFHWSVETDGVVQQAGLLNPGIVLAGDSNEISLPIHDGGLLVGHEHWVTIRAVRAARTRWAAAGHEIVAAQYRLPGRVERAFTPLPTAPSALEWDLDVEAGGIGSLRIHGQELLKGPIVPSVTRAWTENDIAFFGPERAAEAWTKAGYDRLEPKVRRVADLPDGNGTQLDIDLTCDDTGTRLQFRTVIVERHGIIALTTLFRPFAHGLPHLPRLGHQGRFVPDLTQVSWFGPGPEETYSDRHTASLVGTWSGPVEDQRYRYVVPQESGNHHAVKWAALRSGGGAGVMVFGDGPLDVNAGVHDEAVVAAARHDHELTRADATIVHIDHRQTGLGNGSCGPGVLDRYRIPCQPTRWRWAISALDPATEPFTVLRRGIPGPAPTLTLL
jgi:beta-galactosidase